MFQPLAVLKELKIKHRMWAFNFKDWIIVKKKQFCLLKLLLDIWILCFNFKVLSVIGFDLTKHSKNPLIFNLFTENAYTLLT